MRQTGLVLGLVILISTWIVPPPGALGVPAWHVAGAGLMMAIWWLSEALPLAATALVPLALFPLLGAMPIRSTAAAYAHPIVFLFLGGFLIALAMQRWQLHRRIALLILSATGTAPGNLIAGFMAATAVLSMWVSNSATAVMMVPIALSVLSMANPAATAGDSGRRGEDGFAVALLLGIAYAANVGGIATLIGTPPNALLAAFMSERYGVEIGFARWMAVGLPFSLVMLIAIWLLLTRIFYPVKGVSLAGAQETIRAELAALGPMRRPERRIAVVFAVTAAFWMARPALQDLFPDAALSDAGIAVSAGLVLFAFPAGNGDGTRLLDWKSTERLPWEVLILFGGGLSLAGAIAATGLAEWIGAGLVGLGAWPLVGVVLAVIATVVLLTELTSNTATTATFLPIVAALAESIAAPVHVLVVPMALAASCAFMMPVATPPNAIVFASGMLTVGQMARAGIWLNLLATLMITLAAYTLIGWVLAG